MNKILKVAVHGEILADNQFVCQIVNFDSESMKKYYSASSDTLGKNIAAGNGYIVQAEDAESAAITFASYIMPNDGSACSIPVRVNNVKIAVVRQYTTKLVMG